MRPCPDADERTITDFASWLAKKATRTCSEGLACRGQPRGRDAGRGDQGYDRASGGGHRLRQRNEVLSAIVRLLFMLLRLAGVRLDETHVPDGAAKAKILAAIARARTTLQLAVVLRVLGLSPSRYHAWNRLERARQLDDRSSCPRTTPTQLTAEEVRTMHDLATSGSYRHMSIRGLALHAQNIGMLFASPATWGRLIRERGWLRPRARIHPATPKEGVRATKPNEYWHIDVTVIRLLDGTRVYLHAVIDNFSRRILAWSSLPGSSPNRPARFSPPPELDSTSVEIPQPSLPIRASRTSTATSMHSWASDVSAASSRRSKSPSLIRWSRPGGAPSNTTGCSSTASIPSPPSSVSSLSTSSSITP